MKTFRQYVNEVKVYHSNDPSARGHSVPDDVIEDEKLVKGINKIIKNKIRSKKDVKKFVRDVKKFERQANTDELVSDLEEFKSNLQEYIIDDLDEIDMDDIKDMIEDYFYPKKFISMADYEYKYTVDTH